MSLNNITPEEIRGYIYKVNWAMTGSNRRPTACKAVALPAELIALFYCPAGFTGFEHYVVTG